MNMRVGMDDSWREDTRESDRDVFIFGAVSVAACYAVVLALGAAKAAGWF